MTHYTKYAEEKFEILNKYQIFFTKEQISDCVLNPEKNSKKGKYLTAQKDDLKVIYKKTNGIIKVITFFPIK